MAAEAVCDGPTQDWAYEQSIMDVGGTYRAIGLDAELLATTDEHCL